MKLRNKKTGETYSMWHICIGGEEITSVKQFNDTFEDYIPKEPLIKDEKIRKAVRAWAESCLVERCHYDGEGDFATRWHGIKLDCSEEQLEEGAYTIAELCGDSEEDEDEA